MKTMGSFEVVIGAFSDRVPGLNDVDPDTEIVAAPFPPPLQSIDCI
ncbi:hypothetical protein ACFROC_31765 [Nocardia tengchongensis]